jgi:hypothetical protein
MSQEVEQQATVAEVTPETPRVPVPEIDISALERTNSDVVLQKLSRNCVAVKVTIGAIGTERKMDNASVRLGEHEVSKELLSGARFKLVPPGIKNPLSRIAQQARSAPYMHGTPFVGGAYLVPLARDAAGRSPAQVVFDKIKAAREAYEQKAVALKPEWEAHVNNVRQNFPFEWESMSRYFVNGDVFVSMHKIYSMLFPLGSGLPVDFDNRLDAGLNRLLSSDSLSEADKQVVSRLKPHLLDVVEVASRDVGTLLNEDNASSWVAEARQATSQAVSQAVKAMIQEPIAEFAQALANIESSLSKGSRFRSDTLNALKIAHGKLQGFSFMVPDDLKQRLAAAGQLINGVDHKEVNSSETAARELAQHFAGIREEISTSEAHMAVYGSFMRGLDI